MITEQELDDMGFKLIEEYPHDTYITKKYEKMFITIETTFDQGEMVHQNLTISDDYFENISLKELQQLDKILNKEL